MAVVQSKACAVLCAVLPTVMVMLPVLIALLLAAVDTAAPGYHHWRECVAMNPAFPPSVADFFFRGQTTSLPGHQRLTKALPRDVAQLLAMAEEDLEAEEVGRAW